MSLGQGWTSFQVRPLVPKRGKRGVADTSLTFVCSTTLTAPLRTKMPQGASSALLLSLFILAVAAGLAVAIPSNVERLHAKRKRHHHRHHKPGGPTLTLEPTALPTRTPTDSRPSVQPTSQYMVCYSGSCSAWTGSAMASCEASLTKFQVPVFDHNCLAYVYRCTTQTSVCTSADVSSGALKADFSAATLATCAALTAPSAQPSYLWAGCCSGTTCNNPQSLAARECASFTTKTSCEKHGCQYNSQGCVS